MASSDKDAYITACLATACRAVWEKLSVAVNEQTCSLIFGFFTQPCLEMMDADTREFVQQRATTSASGLVDLQKLLSSSC